VLGVLATLVGACDVTGAPAASVGDAEISHEQLEDDVAAFRFLTGLSGAPCGVAIGGESERAACTRFTLTNKIQEELVKAYAAANDIAVEATAVTDAIAQLEQNLGGAEELDARLRQEDLTRLDLDTLATRLLLFGEVESAVVAERLDEETLMGLYEEAVPQFTTVEVHHILLETRAEAGAVAAEAGPRNFARLARERSVDTGSAANGGNLGSYSESQFRAQFDPTFVEAALALEPGEVSGVVETQFGFHVIFLARRDVATFEQVRDQLVAQQSGEIFEGWLREQYETFDVEVNPRYGRLDETGQVLPIRSTDDDAGATGATGTTGATGATGAAGATAP
jgi:foldase protein PrsA